MKYFLLRSVWLCCIFSKLILVSCNNQDSSPTKEIVSQLNLKRGAIISCAPAGEQFGTANFDMSCNEKTATDFNLAIVLLHSFEYDESEKVFAKIIDDNPGCAMAYWGVAMCNFHALWTAPSEAELVKGEQAIKIANSIANKSARESGYINAIAAFYHNWQTTDHRSRCIKYEQAMEKLQRTYPADKEAAIFYALSLDASANPNDKTFANQKKAAGILNALYASNPNHPGIIHYIIHTYDYPGMAEGALQAAKKYAQIAPSSAHALHMPSHIFTRLGLWDECIESNLVSVAAAKCYAEQAKMKGHWDEEVHGLDYLVYAYLQKGQNKLAEAQVDYLNSIDAVYPVNFKVAYAFASIPARFLLENKNWAKAASLPLPQKNFSWKQFPWQESIVHFTRLLGLVHTGNIKDAHKELMVLNQLHHALAQQKDEYKTKQVAIQVKAGEAWIAFKSGKTNDGINLMKLAADMESTTEKHPVTPGEIVPARELLGDMLLAANQPKDALLAYEAALARSPNRFNSLYGAGLAARKAGNQLKAENYFKKLLLIIGKEKIERPEISLVQSYLKEG